LKETTAASFYIHSYAFISLPPLRN